MAKLVLPDGLSVKQLVERVRASQGPTYEHAVQTAVAYLNGLWRADTEAWIRRVFPNTADAIEPVGYDVLRPVSEAKALVFDGTPKLDLLRVSDSTAVTETPDGTRWATVLDEADLWATLRRLDVTTVASRLAFVRVLWDAVDARLRLDLFTADRVFPLYDPDRPDIQTAPVVMLELEGTRDAKGNPVRRFEVWTAVQDGTGATASAEVAIVDESGEILKGPERNPYRGPDGLQDQDRYPVIPVMAIGDSTGVTWPYPVQSLVDAQRSVNISASNRLYCTLTQAHGQWVAQQTERNAEQWNSSGGPRDPVTRSRFRERPTETSTTVSFGPAEVVNVPFGFALQHVAQGAQLDALTDAMERDLRNTCTLNGVPARTLVPTAEVASGVAMLVEREPLERYRRERVASFRRNVGRLGDLCRIVWNTHHEQPQRFLADGGLVAKFVPDTSKPVLDPIARADLAIRLAQTGLYTDAERLAMVEGVSVADAQARLDANRETLAAAQAARTGLVSRVFASPLAQARARAAETEDDDDEDDGEDG